jgi:hypothetical protein
MRGEGNYATKGHSINYPQDITPMAQRMTLPHREQDLPIVIVRKARVDGQVTKFNIRRVYIQVWLNWLKRNSPLEAFRNININRELINNLPENGPLPNLRISITEMEMNIMNTEINNELEVNILLDLQLDEVTNN